MASIKSVLKKKGSQVWAVQPETPIIDALKLMADHDIGAVLVMQGEQAVGILSERDYARKVVLKGKTSRATPVREIMSAPVISVRPQQSIEECMSLMARKHIRHLPVIENQKVTGMISIGDVMSAIIAEREHELERMEQAARGDTGLLES